MTLSAASATAQLDSIQTVDELRILIDKLDINTKGNITILYSGAPANGLNNSDLIQALLINSEDIRVIDNTEAAKFLSVFDGDSPDFNQPLVDKLVQLTGPNPRNHGSAANKFLFGDVGTDGARVPNGAWDSVSSRFVSATVGEIRTVTGGATSGRVFGQTEVPRALANPNITFIDGIAAADLRRLGPEKAFQAISAQSNVFSSQIRVAIDGAGNIVRPPRVDARPFFAAPDLVGKPPAVEISRYRPLTTFMPNRIEQHAEGAKVLRELKAEYRASSLLTGAEHAASRAAALKALSKLGIAGDLFGLLFAVRDANAAYAEDNTAKGNAILQDWLADFLGGAMGGLVAGQAAAVLLAGLAVTPAGFIAVGTLTFLFGVLGSVAGSNYAQSILDELRGLFTTAKQTRSPLALDLDGDGVTTLARDASGVHFDHDGNGFAELSGWVSPRDALLVRDLDGNGRIDSGAELFGNHTKLTSGARAANGFAALSELDLDKNGSVDLAEAEHAGLRLWRDLDTRPTAVSPAWTDRRLRAADVAITKPRIPPGLFFGAGI